MSNKKIGSYKRKESVLKNKLFKDKKFLILLILLVVLIVVGIVFYVVRNRPSTERMTLNEYYELKEGEMAVLSDKEYYADKNSINGIVRDGMPYVKVDIVNEIVDDVFAYDNVEHVVCFTTPNGTVKAKGAEHQYLNNGVAVAVDYQPFVEENQTAYIALEFVKATADITYTFTTDPDRVVIHPAGKERTIAKIDGDTQMRRFGGVKSKILKDAKDGEEVTLVEDYGRWSLVVSEDGVRGCVKNSDLEDKEKITNKRTLPEVKYTHNLYNEKIRMGWYQVGNAAGNATISETIASAPGMNVISPTWIQIKDNKGAVSNNGTASAVETCHSNGIKVWALVGNVDHDVDENTLLNVTSARENLINNIMNNATSLGVDGINVDIEDIDKTAYDGYVEFLKELSIKCKEKNMVLSVDDYSPNSSNYNIKMQERYADYLIFMGYDEHWTGSPEAGSNASIDFVRSGIKAFLDLGVDKERLILGIPFYTRVWTNNNGILTSEAIPMKKTEEILSKNNAVASWDKELCQNYAEWNTPTGQSMIWIEDNKSLTNKCELAMEKGLAGVSGWKLGQEDDGIWEMIGKTVK